MSKQIDDNGTMNPLSLTKEQILNMIVGAGERVQGALTVNDRRRYHLNNLLKIPKRRRGNRQNHEIRVLRERLGVKS